ncbi:reverse transcriptase [Tanacetum coccineum]
MVNTRQSTIVNPENNDTLRDNIAALISEEIEKMREEIRVTKIEFLRFGGEDVRGWLFKCEQFFKVDDVAKDHKGIMFLGPYRQAILQRFGLAYDDPLAEIKKIRHVKYVEQYIDEYDNLLCRVELSEEQSGSFFLVGLQNDVKVAVRMFKSRSLAELYWLVKLQEGNLNAMKSKNKMPLFPNSRFSGSNSTYLNNPKPVSLPTPNSNWRNRIANLNTAPIRKQLTHKELEEKRAKNLCFYYDQKYVFGHKCLSHMFSLEVVVDNDEEDIVWEPTNEDVDYELSIVLNVVQEESSVPHISLNALTGRNTFQTMRVSGYVEKHEIHILIDSGSTYNFLDSNTAKRLGCQLKSTYPLQVTVTNGNNMMSSKMCRVK